MNKDTMIGINLVKNIFQLRIATLNSEFLSRKKLSRERFKEFMKAHDSAIVVLEACGSAPYWVETLSEMEHDVKLIVPNMLSPLLNARRMMLLTPRRLLWQLSVLRCVLSTLKGKSSVQKQFCFDRVSLWFINVPNRSSASIYSV